jgi:hypothetical protein
MQSHFEPLVCPPSLPRLRRGFALVVTLSLMILLTVIAVGLLGLSAVSLRSSSREMSQAEARANARLALMVAIGELQKGLGPDRRISAKAEILDRSPDSARVDDVANPHYLGVWDSWDTWLTDKKGPLSIRDTYTRGRHPSLFRGWLVSHPDSDKYETAISAASTPNMVLICGEGSAGADPVNHVRAGRVAVRDNKRLTGNYAWWISDESQKVRLDLKAREDAGSVTRAQLIASHTGRMGIEKMSAMAKFDTSPEALGKMITTGQAGVGVSGHTEHFHDLTAYSLGLLTDVRSGGFKADLNLAFESDKVPAEMDAATLFGSRSFDAPIRPMTGELSKISPQNPFVAPMSWRQMREFYRVYRGGFSDSKLMQPVSWSGGSPESRRFLMGKQVIYDWDSKGYARQLVMLRQTWILATTSRVNPIATGGIEYYILAIPVLTLWNPYNITLRVAPTEISYLGALISAISLRQRTYRDGVLLGETTFPDQDNWPRNDWVNNRNPNHDIVANQLGYRMIPSETNSRSGIKFAPGEVRIFSTDTQILHGVGELPSPEAMKSRHFFASSGYTPVKDTNSGILRGLKYRINPGGSGRGTLSFSLRIAEPPGTTDNFFFGASKKAGLVWGMQELLSSGSGIFYENGEKVTKQSTGEWHDAAFIGATSVDWVTERELEQAWIVRDEPANRAQWGPPGEPPIPIGIYSVVAKSPERLAYDSTTGFAADFRNRGWLHAPPTRLASLLMNPVNLNRADSPYQLHFRPVNGDQEVSQYLQAEGQNGFFGGGYTPAQGQTHVTALALPTVPVVNLGSFAGIRMDRARARTDMPGGKYAKVKAMAPCGGAFGVGIGNGYAHPMIAPDQVYTRNNFGADQGFGGQQSTNIPLKDDYWDHLFLANEELWDSWFCSGIAPVVNNGSVVTPKKTVAKDFFSNKGSQLSRHFQPTLRDKTPEDLSELVEITSAAVGGNGWDLIASYMLNQGQFNVNSTSKQAWKALLMSLSDRPLACNDKASGPSLISRDPDRVSLSRHPLANSKGEAKGPGDENAWHGIRKLTETQIDKLAEEIVRQVKLRGPFLNMAEFINRRLSADALGVTGALQAAIDWDEFNQGYNGSTSGSGESINSDYKSGGAMITDRQLPAAYPHPKAAVGSRYAGIPGYVMQSDILQGISSSLSVRGDTFVVRSYGESLTADGKVAATAWCEAVVQRVPDYVDPTDAADKKLRLPAQPPGGALNLGPTNQKFGRRFTVVSFRWLNQDEI